MEFFGIFGIFWNFLLIEVYNINTLATKFSTLLFLYCYNQVAEIVTLSFNFFCLLQKRLLSIEKLKLLVEIVELQ